MLKKYRALRESNSSEWFTPKIYVDAAREVLGGIDLDPASCEAANEIVQATKIFTKEDNGLAQAWGGRVWLNPPYGGMSGPFTQKLISHYLDGNVSKAILLLNSNATDTKWFRPLWDYMLCFTNHRIKFLSPPGTKKSNSTHGNVFVYFGPDEEKFGIIFQKFGAVVKKWNAWEYYVP